MPIQQRPSKAARRTYRYTNNPASWSEIKAKRRVEKWMQLVIDSCVVEAKNNFVAQHGNHVSEIAAAKRRKVNEMGQCKELVRVNLTKEELAMVDIYRQGVKARTGKLPMRSVAIAAIIKEAGDRWPAVEPRTFAELIAMVDEHTRRLDEIDGGK